VLRLWRIIELLLLLLLLRCSSAICVGAINL
jgi:hypothetical protein